MIGREYRLERPLGSGGMGDVWVATQIATGRARALKLLQPALVHDARVRARFADEARVGARIASEHVVEVVGAGVDDATGSPWLAMELLEGEDLARAIERRGRIPPRELADLLEQVGHALAAAHDAGIVHRDLKPENVFLARARRVGAETTVKILDFGIAAVLPDDRTNATVTSALGTPLWWAPEQMRVGEHVRPATDVWSLGLIVFRALTGRFYWRSAYDERANVAMLVTEILVAPMAPASERARELGAEGALPPGLDAWLASCVAREQGARFATARAAIAALLPLLRAEVPAPRGGARSMALAQTAPLPSVPATMTPTTGSGLVPPATRPHAVHAIASQPGTDGGVHDTVRDRHERPRVPWALLLVGVVLAIGATGATAIGLWILRGHAVAPAPATATEPPRAATLEDAGAPIVLAASAPAVAADETPPIAAQPALRYRPGATAAAPAPVEAPIAPPVIAPAPIAPIAPIAPVEEPAPTVRAPEPPPPEPAPIVRAPDPPPPAPEPAPAPSPPPAPTTIVLERPAGTRQVGNTSGGSAYDDACGAGQALVGLEGNDVPYIGRIRAVCGRLTLPPSPGRIGVAGRTELPLRGVLGGATERIECGEDEVVVGFEGRAGLLVDRLSLRCATLTLEGDGSIRITPAGETGAIGGQGGDAFGGVSCPGDRIARVARIRAGDGVDAFGLGCAEPIAR